MSAGVAAGAVGAAGAGGAAGGGGATGAAGAGGAAGSAWPGGGTASAWMGVVGAAGGVATDELERTLNMGVGMVAVVAGGDADRAVRLLTDRGVPAWTAGQVSAGSGAAELVGKHPAG